MAVETFVRGVPLARLQARFGEKLSSPVAGESHGLAFRGDPAAAERRFAHYRNNLAAAYEKALTATFPVVKQQLGEDCFFGVSVAYGHQYPSGTGDLNRFGVDFAAFLDASPLAIDYPWLADLARLEWALHRSHYAHDAVRLDAAAVAALQPEKLEILAPRLHPACAVLHSPWDIVALWAWHQQTEPGAWTGDIRQAVTALVYRPRWRVETRALGDGEAAGLIAISNGLTLGEALEAALVADEALDVAAVFARWLNDGVLAERPAVRPFKQIRR